MAPAVHSLRDACRALDSEAIGELTLDLTRIWSPPGDEARMADRMAEEWDAIGARVTIDSAYPSSPSVIVEFGRDSGPTLQWHGHLDAVDLEHEPPRRHGDLVIGRGAADMKGPLAAMLAAARLLGPRDVPGRVLVTLHGMHESGGNEPLHDLIARGIHGDAVITGELGGGLDLPIAGLGLSFWTATITGPAESVHEVLVTDETVDPVEVGRILHGELAALRDELAAQPGKYPTPSLFIGQFSAGDYVNRVPVRGHIRGTRRHDLTMTPDQVIAELRSLVARVSAVTGATIDLDVIPVADSFAVDPHETIVTAMQRAHRELTGRVLPVSRSKIASNAVHFVQEAGIPAVGYGPDPISNHSGYEYVSVSDLGRIAGGFALGTAHYFERVGSSDA